MSAPLTGLPAGWEVRRSNTKNLPYYFHPATKDSRWEPPAGTDSAQLTAYMAENHSTHGISQTTFPAKSSEKIRAAHLLVKHQDSRRPASWREQKITRTQEEARERIEQFKAQILAGTSLSELAAKESDCSSARKGGDLGFFGRGDMQKEFEDAAFALKPGEMSDVVTTASGLHLILRLE